VLSAVALAARPEFSVHAHICRPAGSGWSPVERPADARLVLVRAGRFRRRTADGLAEHDPTVGYVGAPGEEDQFAHPHGGDVCTSLSLNAAAWRRLTGEPGGTLRRTFYVDAAVELAHRRLLAAADIDYGLAENLLALVVTAVRRVTDGRTPLTDRPVPADAHLVQRARAAIHDDHPAARGLFPLAELLGVSPYRLSRAFPREFGVTLTAYRNRVRVGRALERLQADTSRLADIAAELGFADQAHMTRVVRAHLGHTPRALRHTLKPRTAGYMSRPMSSTRTEWVSAPTAR
jgi:AraC-like DNA-binding protein